MASKQFKNCDGTCQYQAEHAILFRGKSEAFIKAVHDTDRRRLQIQRDTVERQAVEQKPGGEHQGSPSNDNTRRSQDSEETCEHLGALAELEAGKAQAEKQMYHAEEEGADHMPVLPPRNNQHVEGDYKPRQHRPFREQPRDWIREADELEATIGSASGTRYYRS
ncbi:hypothetical protein TruAng_011558 [Truncatella angustata]|nr:hypothetical protein TruAng_011558 [Truncatella angustata]